MLYFIISDDNSFIFPAYSKVCIFHVANIQSISLRLILLVRFPCSVFIPFSMSEFWFLWFVCVTILFCQERLLALSLSPNSLPGGLDSLWSPFKIGMDYRGCIFSSTHRGGGNFKITWNKKVRHILLYKYSSLCGKDNIDGCVKF